MLSVVDTFGFELVGFVILLFVSIARFEIASVLSDISALAVSDLTDKDTVGIPDGTVLTEIDCFGTGFAVKEELEAGNFIPDAVVMGFDIEETTVATLFGADAFDVFITEFPVVLDLRPVFDVALWLFANPNSEPILSVLIFLSSFIFLALNAEPDDTVLELSVELLISHSVEDDIADWETLLVVSVKLAFVMSESETFLDGGLIEGLITVLIF